jgi:EAL domain-containing protein (putative c-di-GMP-specific phosphodiesterase class I)
MCRMDARLQARHAMELDLRLAIANISTIQFKNPHLLSSIAAALRESGLPASRLEFEITESVMLADNDSSLATLHQLHALGAHIAMDDFGTGYSSLSYLRSFPFDKIKIDQSFVHDLATKPDSQAIICAIIALGNSLGMQILAEGVDTYEQLNRLRDEGRGEVQGLYLQSLTTGRRTLGVAGPVG